MWSGADDALDPAPPAAVLLRARCMCSGPRTHLRTATGSDQRARQDRLRPVPAAPHVVLGRFLLRRRGLLLRLEHQEDRSQPLANANGCSRSCGKVWE